MSKNLSHEIIRPGKSETAFFGSSNRSPVSEHDDGIIGLLCEFHAAFFVAQLLSLEKRAGLFLVI